MSATKGFPEGAVTASAVVSEAPPAASATQPIAARSAGTYPVHSYDDGETTGQVSAMRDVAAYGDASDAAPQPAQSQPGQPAPSAQTPRPAEPAKARRVRLTVGRVDPWSAMKMSFLLSVALGIALVVMTFVMWTILNGMGVFDKIDEVLVQLRGAQAATSSFTVRDFVGLGRVLSLSVVVAVIDVVLMTAIATLGAFLYNVSATLVGGIQLTLTDD